jgi:hypothetical protein
MKSFLVFTLATFMLSGCQTPSRSQALEAEGQPTAGPAQKVAQAVRALKEAQDSATQEAAAKSFRTAFRAFKDSGGGKDGWLLLLEDENGRLVEGRTKEEQEKVKTFTILDAGSDPIFAPTKVDLFSTKTLLILRLPN